MDILEGGVTGPMGFRAAGEHVGIKKNGQKDLAVLVSDEPATVAAMFTTNRVKAAPVVWSQRLVARRAPMRAVVVNSGNANACTGDRGLEDAIRMGEATARALGIAPDEVLVASTGVIGVPLPMEEVLRGIPVVVGRLAPTREAGTACAQAIRTTDTFTKQAAVQVEIGGRVVTLGGMAKGSGMIHPNMATMLAFVTTDAAISREMLERALRESVVDSYNMISVDGDTSTNDTVAVLANGLAGNPEIGADGPDFAAFREALHALNTHLAKCIVRDGEGATKLMEVHVQGAQDVEAARRLARSVTTSNLVKAALFGADANWGRVLAAMGYSGASFNPAGVRMRFTSAGGTVSLMEDGEPLPFDEDLALRVLGEKEVRVEIELSDGDAAATAWGCDLTYEYVRINGEYRS
ncbi:bifunctional glutamate N-acetyltransferase/amino-acid acetyltransferase ArgJ [Alicyclobacillus sp.]|uniref:bifunctional glutamate N-acetyltransferase/amino-acid acetyltransferase ArgJ n=1 Tax=Alicyclobacillus sp. TaxID=61169 RepID=UPI0025BD99A9|nr:bifunctional glutamate N-acetyltransferase/amino-acid acetyltransferase ArgJ [Alicyclobacillus sp.]MCL6516915.1 bifunctional glutamate N-acetyltransferase/amino-acid acetyltransferase ArgJ [Alicyclobacillus sp.]